MGLLKRFRCVIYAAQNLKTSTNPAKSAFGTDMHSMSFALRLRHHLTNIKTAVIP